MNVHFIQNLITKASIYQIIGLEPKVFMNEIFFEKRILKRIINKNKH